jgi:hypothetical protein
MILQFTEWSRRSMQKNWVTPDQGSFVPDYEQIVDQVRFRMKVRKDSRSVRKATLRVR